MEQHLLPITAFVTIVSAIGALLFGLSDLLTPKKRSRTALKNHVRNLPKTTSAEGEGFIARFDRWFAMLLYQSGLSMGVMTALLLLVVAAFVAGALVWIGTENPALTCAAGLVAMAISLGILTVVRRRRMKKFEQLFPNSLDILARAVRAGESLDQAIELVSTATQEPVAAEFRRCSKQLDMGLSVAATMQSMSERIGQTDVKIFSSTLAIHRDGGGNLPEALDRLSSLIRDRLDYRRQMRSVSSAGRFSVLVILILAPILLAYLFLFRPEYGLGLWQDPIGRWMLVLSLVGQIVGLFWVSRILKNDY